MAGACRQFGGSANHVAIDNDGILSLHGDGRVYCFEWVSAEGIKVPGTKPATEVALGLSKALQFTDGTDDTVIGKIRMPMDADYTVNPDFYVGWSSPTADPGDNSKQATWSLAYSIHGLNADMSDSTPDTTTPGTFSASTSTNGLVMSAITVTGGQLGDVCFEYILKRLGAAATLGDVANLSGVCIRYVKNKCGGIT